MQSEDAVSHSCCCEHVRGKTLVATRGRYDDVKQSTMWIYPQTRLYSITRLSFLRPLFNDFGTYSPCFVIHNLITHLAFRSIAVASRKPRYYQRPRCRRPFVREAYQTAWFCHAGKMPMSCITCMLSPEMLKHQSMLPVQKLYASSLNVTWFGTFQTFRQYKIAILVRNDAAKWADKAG